VRVVLLVVSALSLLGFSASASAQRLRATPFSLALAENREADRMRAWERELRRRSGELETRSRLGVGGRRGPAMVPHRMGRTAPARQRAWVGYREPAARPVRVTRRVVGATRRPVLARPLTLRQLGALAPASGSIRIGTPSIEIRFFAPTESE
jgi:hypothetical protein